MKNIIGILITLTCLASAQTTPPLTAVQIFQPPTKQTVIAQGTKNQCSFTYYGAGYIPGVHMTCIKNAGDKIMEGDLMVPPNSINGLHQTLYLDGDVFNYQLFNRPGTTTVQLDIAVGGIAKTFTFI